MTEGLIWHVVVTVAGDARDVLEVRDALERLRGEQPFLIDARYARDRAELEYWEEAEGCEDAAALALRLWGEHRGSAGLPPWEVLGLEVVERDAFEGRSGDGAPLREFVPLPARPRTSLRALPTLWSV